jgi:putative membrane protein
MVNALVTATVDAQRWMDGDHMDGWGWVMGIGVLLVLVLIAALVFFLVRESGRNSSGAGGPSAQDALDHRFARGEIDEDEYRKRRDILKN